MVDVCVVRAAVRGALGLLHAGDWSPCAEDASGADKHGTVRGDWGPIWCGERINRSLLAVQINKLLQCRPTIGESEQLLLPAYMWASHFAAGFFASFGGLFWLSWQAEASD